MANLIVSRPGLEMVMTTFAPHEARLGWLRASKRQSLRRCKLNGPCFRCRNFETCDL